VVELLDKFTYDEEENNPLYRLLVNTLERLNRGDEPQLALRYYEMQLLDLLGFRPELHKCVSCGAKIQPEAQYFSSAQGGVLCPACGSRAEGATPISMAALKYLRHFQRSSYRDATRAKPSLEVQGEMEALMQHHLTYLLERGLNSPAFLRRVRGEQEKID
jgi:DNA repair protein RecO (recombination protein O)